MVLKQIAHIECDFCEKFGIPRQSGLVETAARIVFEKDFADEKAFRGIQEYSHLWLIWHFSANKQGKFSPTVRPPRLGGNKRMGVFATRSPNRPNPIGLSSVKLEKVEIINGQPVLYVSGADLLNNTPIFDIKPYLAYTDSHADAKGGFSDEVRDYYLDVVIPKEICSSIPIERISEIRELISQDMRPSYQNDPDRIYGFSYAEYEIKFKVAERTAQVLQIDKKRGKIRKNNSEV